MSFWIFITKSEEQVIKNYEDEDEIEFGSVNLDKQSNVWLGVRFNITKIPFIILIENKRMYKYPEQLFEESFCFLTLL